MKKAALFFDIDGTILSEETKEIPKSAIEALLEVKKKGHLLFINTGRTMCSIPAELKQFAFDGYLCGCGTYLTYHDEVLFTRSIEKKRGREILNKMAECNLDGIAEGTADIYLPERISRFERLETSGDIFTPVDWDGNVIWKKMILSMTRCLFMRMREAIFRNSSASLKRIWKQSTAEAMPMKSYKKGIAKEQHAI